MFVETIAIVGAVIGGKLYLRDQEYIACYDVKGS